MKKFSWLRVGPLRRQYLQALPGILLILSVVNVNALQKAAHEPVATSGTAQTKSDKGAVEAANKKAAAKAAKVNSTKKSTAVVAPIPATLIPTVPASAARTVAVNRQMWFIPTPTTDASARSLARDAASQLQQFAAQGLQALVIMEPTVQGGGNVNFSTYQNGGYDQALTTFYTALKGYGVTDQTMGMWTLLPEANMPEWGVTTPGSIVACITRTAQLQKQVFPGSLTSLMLNAITYPTSDTNYEHGEYKSLAPYVQGIASGLIDSLGYQGFPWQAPANAAPDSDKDPATFLAPNIAIDAARTLGVHSIWFNTGTFSSMYTNNASQTVHMDAVGRSNILNGIYQQAVKIEAAGYGVGINIFGENKAGTSEAIDWSYGSAADQQALNNFRSQSSQSGINTWIYQ